MHLTAVICTRNRPDLIGRAVASVLANDHTNVDLVIVDQSDSDAAQRALDPVIAGHANVRYIHTSRVGLSAAYNTAIARSTGEVLAFTDDDCVVPSDWLRRIDEAFAREADIDLLYGQVLIPAALRNAEGVTPDLPITARRRISRRDGFMIYGMGANFAARHRLFQTVGGFDEVLGGGGPLRSSQDFDFQYRVYRAGGVTLLAPEVVVEHYGLRTPEQWPLTLAAYGAGDGGYLMKHVRCGDLLATRLLLHTLARQVARFVVRRVRRRPNASAYLRGLLRGLRDSFRFAIDRDQRLYAPR